MIFYTTYQNKRKGKFAGKWYGRTVHTETIDLEGLAKHMASHNCSYSKGQIRGVLTDMVKCIYELITNGKKVKVPNLGIFFLGAQTVPALTAKEFTADNVKALRLRCMPTGNVRFGPVSGNSNAAEVKYRKVKRIVKAGGTEESTGKTEKV